MQFWTAAAAATFALAACSQPTPAPEAPAAQIPVEAHSGVYPLDPNHSTVTVRARHFGLSNYVLRLNSVSGSLNFNAENPEQSSVEATVAVTSLDTPYAGDRDFDAELQNSQWLDSASFPNATFRSTSIERTGPSSARVTGDLTLKGVTRPVTFDVTYNASYARHPMGQAQTLIGFSGRAEISRSQFGITELMPSPGANDGVSDQVEILIEAEFTRPNEDAPNARAPAEPVN